MNTWKELVIKVLQEKDAMTLKDIISGVSTLRAPAGKHFDANIRGILNRGVAGGLFERAGKGVYRLKKSAKPEATEEVHEESKPAIETPDLKDAIASLSKVLQE